MRLKVYCMALGAIAFLGIVGYAVYTVRQYIPYVGIVFLIAVGVACGAVVPAIMGGLYWLFLHLREKRHRSNTVHLQEFGAYYFEHGQAFPLHTSAVYAASVTPRVIEAVQAMAALPEPALPVAPPFSQIASQIAPGHLFLGQGVSGPIWGDVTDLLSTIITGRPGTGKTTKLRDVCAQVLIIGGLPILFDPHGSIVDDLGSAFQCAESPKEIEEQAEWLDNELDMRLKARRAGKPNPQSLLLLVDEMPIISSMCELAVESIRRIVLEGRKVGMFALVSGQGVPASILGGTLVRDAMASRYVFCTTPQQARMAGIENETAKKLIAVLENAGPGKAILATSRSKPEIVAIPDTTVNDIRLLTLPPGNHGNTLETAREADISQVFPFPSTGPMVSVKAVDDVGNDIRETIKRMRSRGLSHRDVASFVGLSGRKYSIYQRICREEGLMDRSIGEGL